MEPQGKSDTRESAVDERRRAARYVTDQPVELVFDLTRVDGRAQNISAEGISVFADRALTVRVKVGGANAPTELLGKIVRMESVDAQRVAIAIRFDESLDLGQLEIET